MCKFAEAPETNYYKLFESRKGGMKLNICRWSSRKRRTDFIKGNTTGCVRKKSTCNTRVTTKFNEEKGMHIRIDNKLLEH